MNRFHRHIIPIFTTLTVLSSCGEGTKKETIQTQNIAFQKEGELRLLKPDGSLIKKLDIEIADNEYETQTGLMHRKSMLENRAMLFIFDQEDLRFFYMKNTEISLDIIYIDENFKVVSFIENATPFNEDSLPSEKPARYVLEINAGLLNKWGIQQGDSISFQRN